MRLEYDQLHLATGATPVRPAAARASTCRSSTACRTSTTPPACCAASRPAAGRAAVERVGLRVVVVGGGYIGIEMAEAFVQRGAEVTLVEGSPQVMPTLDADMAAPLAEAMGKVGIDVRLDTRVEGIEAAPARGGGAGSGTDAVVAGGDRFPADLVVLGLGVAPNGEPGRRRRPRPGREGGDRVDRRQRTSADGVWAAGDCCESFHLIARAPVHIALGTVANKQGRVAGINIGGGYAAFPGVLGTAVSKVCHTEVGRTGPQRARGASSTASATSPPASRPPAGPATSPTPSRSRSRPSPSGAAGG